MMITYVFEIIKLNVFLMCVLLLQAHVVSAFEQSLSSMTQRLQHLTATAERKVN